MLIVLRDCLLFEKKKLHFSFFIFHIFSCFLRANIKNLQVSSFILVTNTNCERFKLAQNLLMSFSLFRFSFGPTNIFKIFTRKMYDWLSYMTSLEGLKLTSVLVLFGQAGCISFGTSPISPSWTSAGPTWMFIRWTNGVWNNTLKGMVPYTDQSKYYLESIVNHITI